MRTLMTAALFALLSAAGLKAAGLNEVLGGEPDFSAEQGAAYPAVPRPAAAVPGVRAGAALKDWTVMVFLNGKNDLELAGLYNVNMMETVGSTSRVNVVAELGRMSGQAAGDTDLDGDWTGSRRYFIKRDTDTERVNSPVVGEEKAADMGDYKRAAEFVKWAKAKYPARRYMLVLWDHGTGWMDPREKPAAAGKGISFDDETGNYIRTKQIGRLLQEAGRVDLLAFDACLMQMGEVVFEVKDRAGVIVGAEENVPGLGYPYDSILAALAASPGMTAEQLGASIVGSFKIFYDGVGKSAQLSAIRADRLGAFGRKLAEAAALAREINDVPALKLARAGVLRYDVVGADADPDMTISFFGDLHQYLGLLAAGMTGTDAKTAAFKAKAAELQEYIDTRLVIANKSSGRNRLGRDLGQSHGLSVYLPPAEERIPQEKLESIFEGSYRDFEFDKATRWHDFVTFLYGVK